MTTEIYLATFAELEESRRADTEEVDASWRRRLLPILFL
jgi:hypothetical protein